MAQSVFELVGRILIDNADALEKISDTTVQAKGLADALNGTGESADKTGKKLGSSGKFGSGSVWFGNMMTKMTDMAVNVGKFIGKTGFTFNANMEAYQGQFSSLLGDADKAAKLVADLQNLAKISPLGMEGLAKNAISLLTTGFELADIIPTLQSLGDLSLGDQNKMDSVVRAYTQIVAKGQMMAQEMYQLSDAGVPIIEIMTKYGGDRYASGEWYMQKLTDKEYMIPAEHVVKAFAAATAEGGKWNDYMFNMMDTWLGQTDRMGEEGKESIGAFMEPFFEVAKSDVLPKAAESLALFGTWATENQSTLASIAETVGKFATISFDGALNFFKWMTENGDAVAAAIGVIGTAMGVAAVTAHPYATAVAAIASAIMLLKSEAGQKRGTYDHMFDGYSEADIEVLNRYVDAMNAVKAAEDAALNDATGNSWGKYDEAVTAEKAALEELLAIENLYQTYNTWHQAQAGYAGANGPALNVELQIDEDAESVVQSDIDGMNFSATVKMYPDTSALNRSYSYITGVDGSHANGLDYVPHDGYIARLHQGESVLTRQEASVWRNGTGGGFDVDALARRFASSVASAMSGMALSFDKGATVGQLLPAIDTGLGTTSTRKGRRN